MPRGSSAEEMRKISKKTQFNGDTAVKAGKKSGQTRKLYASLRECLKKEMTAEEQAKICEQLKKRGMQGNLTAIKMLFDYSLTEEEKQADNEIKIILSKEEFDEYSN